MLNQRGLSRTGMADYADQLAFLNLKVDVVYRRLFKRRAAAVAMGKMFCFDDRHVYASIIF